MEVPASFRSNNEFIDMIMERGCSVGVTSRAESCVQEVSQCLVKFMRLGVV